MHYKSMRKQFFWLRVACVLLASDKFGSKFENSLPRGKGGG